MTNNFSTLKNSLSSRKFYLVRMNPARSIMNDLTLVSGNTYTHTFHVEQLSSIKVNGTAYAKVTSSPNASEYTFDENTRLITINLHDTLANIQASGNIVAFYYLFYTDAPGVYANQDPEDANTPMVFWDSRLQGSPNFEETQEDIIDGFLSIGNTTVSLINNDSDFQKYLTSVDSFSRKEIKIWQCLDSVENIQKFYFGYCSSISIGNTLSISIDNSFNAFRDNYYSNGTLNKSTFNSSDYPNVSENDRDQPIYAIYSRVSKTRDIFFDGKINVIPFTSGSSQLLFVLSDSYTLTNISYTTFRGYTTNRVWAACFASTNNSDLTETASGCTNLSLNITQVDVADSSYYSAGDCVLKNGSYYYYVTGIVSSTRIEIKGPANIANGDTLFRSKIPFVQIVNPKDENEIYVLQYGQDYSVSTDANGVYNITFVNSFEGGFALAGHPDGLREAGLWEDAIIRYRVYNHDDLKHGTIVKKILESVGLVVDSSSITTANTASTEIVNFSIPYFGETSFLDASEYVQNILTSMFALLYINTSLQIGYALISSFSPTDTISNDEIIDGSIDQKIDYKDIKTDLLFENIHGSKLIEYINVGTLQFVNTTRETSLRSDYSSYLHEVNKQKTIKYVTQTMTDSKNKIIDVLSSRRLSISLSTKGINFSSKIGDSFIISSGKLVGIANQINGKILSINKQARETRLSFCDLLGL